MADRLHFVTNGAEFDFDLFESEPRIRYVVASTPRCGSNFLQRALWRTGAAGAPEEYLTSDYVQDFAQRIALESQYPLDPTDASRYLRELWRLRTSGNGVFGLKLHGSHLPLALDKDERLIPPLRGNKWIWIRRRNTVAQAVSYLMADQTGVWIVDGEWLPRTLTKQEPQFDYEAIATRLRQIEDEELLWSRFLFSDNRDIGDVTTVEYEALLDDYPRTLRDAFAFLGLPAPAEFPAAGIQRQSTDLNLEWEDEFRRRSHRC